MSEKSGKIVLMGSGELTATMVEVHKELLAGLAPPQQAVFLDTPAGFQLNAQQIADTAVEYFRTRVQRPLSVASFKSARDISPYEAENAFHTLRNAGYILIGPGSPTYAVRQLVNTPVPDIFYKQIRDGGCLVAASAAALTVGRYTLPVYEIYKVGADIHWVDGLDVLGKFGLNLVVVPHWNNAEGGTHDTRRCFMGELRFHKLEALLPESITIVGLDEHTACIIDLSAHQAVVRGIGRVIVKQRNRRRVFTKGDVFSTRLFSGSGLDRRNLPPDPPSEHKQGGDEKHLSTFWHKIHAIEKDFTMGMQERNSGKVTNALLEMDRVIWQGQQDLESSESISEAREILRDQIVVVGATLAETPTDAALTPLVEDLLSLRDNFRRKKQFAEADALRSCLEQAQIRIEDTPHGVRWKLDST